MSWWTDSIVARETGSYYLLEDDANVVRWDVAWGYPSRIQTSDGESVIEPRVMIYSTHAAVSTDPAVQLAQRRHALLELQRIAFREGFGRLLLLPLGPGQQYVKIVAQAVEVC